LSGDRGERTRCDSLQCVSRCRRGRTAGRRCGHEQAVARLHRDRREWRGPAGAGHRRGRQLAWA